MNNAMNIPVSFCEDIGLQYLKYMLKSGDNIYLKANVTLKTNKEALSLLI